MRPPALTGPTRDPAQHRRPQDDARDNLANHLRLVKIGEELAEDTSESKCESHLQIQLDRVAPEAVLH